MPRKDENQVDLSESCLLHYHSVADRHSGEHSQDACSKYYDESFIEVHTLDLPISDSNRPQYPNLLLLLVKICTH